MQSAVVAEDGLGDRDVLVDGIGLGVGESAGEGDGLGVEGEEGLFGPTETMILMSEHPRIPFNMPDTWIVKESCPTKSELAVYENPGPSNFTWPDCGGEMSFAVSMVTRLWRRPRMQLWPLLVCMVQSTASDFS